MYSYEDRMTVSSRRLESLLTDLVASIAKRCGVRSGCRCGRLGKRRVIRLPQPVDLVELGSGRGNLRSRQSILGCIQVSTKARQLSRPHAPCGTPFGVFVSEKLIRQTYAAHKKDPTEVRPGK